MLVVFVCKTRVLQQRLLGQVTFVQDLSSAGTVATGENRRRGKRDSGIGIEDGSTVVTDDAAESCRIAADFAVFP